MTFAGLRGDDVIHVNALSPNKSGNQQDIIVYLSSCPPLPPPAVWYLLVFDEGRFAPRAVLDESDRQQPKRLFLQTGRQTCLHHRFSVQVSMCVCVCSKHDHRNKPFLVFVQETSDYGRPITVVLETGLQNPDQGPVLDPDQPSILKAEVRPTSSQV